MVTSLEDKAKFQKKLKGIKLRLDKKISLSSTLCSLTHKKYILVKKMFDKKYTLETNRYKNSGKEMYSVYIAQK